VIYRIEQWINDTNLKYHSQRITCSTFNEEFDGFYSSQFLRKSYFVLVDNIPKPDFTELRTMGLGDFIDMPVSGITYKDTYYLIQNQANNLRLHFHELVHVVQWELLGASNFINRYIYEIQNYGYELAPLEKIAYFLDRHYSSGGASLDVSSYVQSKM
jgi:hypothetical protein